MKKNIWQPLNGHSDVWVGQYVVPNFVSNSAAVQLADREFLLYSPGASLLDNWLECFSDDSIYHIVMPNEWHYLGVSHWLDRMPNVHLYATRKAIPALTEKLTELMDRHNQNQAQQLDRHSLSNAIYALEDKRPPLPEGYALLFPPGHRGGDVWLRKQLPNRYSLWITCDSFLNYDRLSNRPLARLMQRAMGAAPGLKISEVVKWLIYDNRPLFRSWVLNQLAVDRPVTLIPSHGEVATGSDLYNQLANLVANRLAL